MQCLMPVTVPSVTSEGTYTATSKYSTRRLRVASKNAFATVWDGTEIQFLPCTVMYRSSV